MAAFDRDLQKSIGLSGARKEIGSGVTITAVSGQAQQFTVATKLRKVRAGFGIMDTDGMPCKATPGLTSNGQATFTRLGPIATSADKVTYDLYGD